MRLRESEPYDGIWTADDRSYSTPTLEEPDIRIALLHTNQAEDNKAAENVYLIFHIFQRTDRTIILPVAWPRKWFLCPCLSTRMATVGDMKTRLVWGS